MKVLVTGGHFTPAYAVIDELKKDTEIVFIGRKHVFEGDSGESFEYETIQKLGIPFYELPAGRLQRRLTKHTIPSILKMPIAVIKAIL